MYGEEIAVEALPRIGLALRLDRGGGRPLRERKRRRG
jgi:hypothetical protein